MTIDPRNTLARYLVGPIERSIESRFLLLLLAAHADDDDQVVRAPVQHLLYGSGLDQDAFTAALTGLIKDGVVSVARRAPLTLRIEPVDRPAAAPRTKPVTPSLSASDVQRVVSAARIAAPDDAPLYWSRFGHVSDLKGLLQRTGLTLDALCARLEDMPPAGPIKRLIALQDKIRRAA